MWFCIAGVLLINYDLYVVILLPCCCIHGAMKSHPFIYKINIIQMKVCLDSCRKSFQLTATSHVGQAHIVWFDKHCYSRVVDQYLFIGPRTIISPTH